MTEWYYLRDLVSFVCNIGTVYKDCENVPQYIILTDRGGNILLFLLYQLS